MASPRRALYRSAQAFQPTWMSPTAEHHRHTGQQPTTTQPSSTRRVTFSLPAQTAQSIRGGVAVAPQSSPPNTRRVAPSAGPLRPASPAAEKRAGFDLSHLRTAAKREKKKAVKSLRA
ncbi:unnamed protein product [Trichogramma brassicae]|uniref:Uncharacterized protein n=1 Tax=Trichogramma brassicae TaxID=86971 RepID=A0A6H5IM02_9HYME|nr:unnamed protein product [Trichogramma brassicae]